jgi:lipopolysaccharide/colanic/teichoic acid biosynthesis glycosyltransferase
MAYQAVNKITKRFFDLFISIILALISAPIILLVGLILFLVQGRPVFYVSSRYVKSDKHIKIYKFRTMQKNALDPSFNLEGRFMRNGYLDIPLDCEVYTPIGRLLERTQLVEILQIYNVIFNGMSLVGNRPLPARNLELLKEFDGWEERFESPAGLSGISQIVGKLNLRPEMRLELECLYSRLYKTGNVLKVDLFIIYYTVLYILKGKSIDIERAREMLNVSLIIGNGK